MEKLEPLIRHKFWILFGLTLPIALIGYYSASGKMAEATTAQEERLDRTLNEIPNGASEPNETFAEGAEVINEELEERFDVQVQKLWEMQTERMTWPKIVVPFVPANYRGEIDSKARYTYARVYPTVIERLWERVQPYVGDPKTNRALTGVEITWPQKVILDGNKIPHASFNLSAPPDNKDVWDAQEDIWLLELIFDAIVRTNADAKFVSDAPVRQIDRIELVGGTGQSSVVASAAPVGMSGDYGEYGGEEMYQDYGGEEMGFGGGMAAGPAKVSFNVAEEFGPQVPEPAEDAAAAAPSSSYGSSEYGMEEDYGMMGMMGAAGQKMQRYIGESGFDPFEAPYRERGFYMSVIILQDHIPDFLAELSSSPWPIRIGRFHIGTNPYAPKTNTGGGYGMGGYGMAMGEYGGEYGGGYGEEEYGGGVGDYGEMGGGFGFGMGGGAAAKPLKLPDYMKMPGSIPPELLSHPDLVQMDFCGIITMYNPVTDDSVEVIDDGSTSEDYEEQLEETPDTPEEAQALAAEEAATAAAQGDAPADPEAAPGPDAGDASVNAEGTGAASDEAQPADATPSGGSSAAETPPAEGQQ